MLDYKNISWYTEDRSIHCYQCCYHIQAEVLKIVEVLESVTINWLLNIMQSSHYFPCVGQDLFCSDIITPMRDELLDYRSAGSSKSKKSIGQRSEMPDIRQLKNFTQSSRKIWEEVILALYCQNYPLGQEYVSNVNTNFPTKDMLLTSSSKPANQHRHVRLTLGYLT